MCIRDRAILDQAVQLLSPGDGSACLPRALTFLGIAQLSICLLYTSDAADERSSVDLGGRRIINKKNTADVVERPTALRDE